MALNDLERKRIEKAVAGFVERRRPPPHIRPELDLGFRISGQSVELFEIRPEWKNPEVKTERPYAKATYIRAQDAWKVYWKRADLKWHSYEPNAVAATIEEFLAVVAKDAYCCFFG